MRLKSLQDIHEFSLCHCSCSFPQTPLHTDKVQKKKVLDDFSCTGALHRASLMSTEFKSISASVALRYIASRILLLTNILRADSAQK